MLEYHDKWLLDEFEKRKKRNSAYSLRAFAKNIKVSPGLLSKIFRGKSQMTPETALKIIENLNINHKQKEKLLTHYKELKRKNALIKKRLINILKEGDHPESQRVKYLNTEEFLQISHWHHTLVFAILQFQDDCFDSFESFCKFISQKANISLQRLQDILKRLENLKLVTFSKNSMELHFDSFIYKGREQEASLDDLLVEFGSSANELAEMGIKSIYPRIYKNELITKSNTLSDGINLINWLFYPISKDTAFIIEKLIENLYADIHKLSLDDLSEATEVYCMSSQFFKATNSIQHPHL